jgi:hypothetical protein
MLNGQPALFIPASAPISSNLLNQMLQINNNGQQQQPSNNNTQSGSVNYSSMNNTTSGINTQSQNASTTTQTLPGTKQEPIDIDDERQPQQNATSANSGSQFANLTNIIGNVTGGQQQQQQQQAIFQLPNGMTMTNMGSLNNQNISIMDTNNQNRQFIPIQQQLVQQQPQQQVVYIQPDGTLTLQPTHQPIFQQIQPMTSLTNMQPRQQQQQSQQHPSFHPIQPKPNVVKKPTENPSLSAVHLLSKKPLSKHHLKAQTEVVDFKMNKVRFIQFFRLSQIRKKNIILK